jgi:hypothetical protein
MNRVWTGNRQLPDRLPSTWARMLAGLAVLILAMAVGGLFLYDGWHRVAYVTAFAAMGLANLAWAVGSLLPEGRPSRALRTAVSSFAVIMMIALGATLAFQLGCGS